MPFQSLVLCLGLQVFSCLVEELSGDGGGLIHKHKGLKVARMGAVMGALALMQTVRMPREKDDDTAYAWPSASHEASHQKRRL